MHEVDACCIALLGAGVVPEREADFGHTFRIRQYRRHDRAKIHHQTERTYRYEGKTVAKNRKPRMEQKDPSLLDWYLEMVSQHGAKEADRMCSRLQVAKNTRHYNTEDRILPGAIFEYQGKRHVLCSQLTGGSIPRSRRRHEELPVEAVQDPAKEYRAGVPVGNTGNSSRHLRGGGILA